MSETRIYCPLYIVPITSNPIANGAIVVKKGRIIAIAPEDQVISNYPDAPVVRLNNHIIMPALVNAHSHIALTDAAGFIPHQEFFGWLSALIPWMRKQSHKALFESSIHGLQGMYKSGITTIGDSSPTIEPMKAAINFGFRSIFFIEVFGVLAKFQSLAILKYSTAIQKALSKQTENIKLGISPHAPYTVTPQVLKMASRISNSRKMRVSMHVAETLDEIEFLQSLKGRFRKQFEPTGKKIPITNLSPLEYVDSFGIVNERFLAIHGVHLTDSEFALLAKRKGHLISCPSSNKNLKIGFLDIRRPLKAGVNTCIGTDSPASSDGIDLFNELRLALKIGTAEELKMNPRDALSMITINPARALGFDNTIGSIEFGKSADFIALKVPQELDYHKEKIEDFLIRKSKSDDIELTISYGEIKYSRIDALIP